MASRQLAKAEAAHAKREADTAAAVKAAEVAEQYPGWHVWTGRKGLARIASRTGNQMSCPVHDGCIRAQTVIADDWPELETLLAEQAQHDAALTCAMEA